jgi:DNA repair exonuclease SbcCD ATPase subunit
MNLDSEHEAQTDASQGIGQKQTPTAELPVSSPPSSEQNKRSWLRRFWPGALLVMLLAALGFVIWQHSLVGDWLVTRGYVAPASISRLASDDGMTAYARRLFFVNRPEIETKDMFNKHCSSQHDEVAVLGCYTGNRQGIYLYDVTDARLDGIQQVTAAHEMLHQAYDRLDSKTRTQVDDELEAYASTITNPDLKAKLATYKKTEPNDVVNEMHSIFGTEVDKLPASLETYYKRYFTDRSKVTKFHDDYQAAFNQRTAQIADYDKQLASLKKEIEDGKASIQAQEKTLQEQRAHMDDLLASNRVGDYNAIVPGFNYQVNAYKQTVSDTNNLIDEYNKLIDSRNQIAVQEQQLQSAIDSHASDAPAQ